MMKSVSHNKSWCSDTEQIHVDPPPIHLIKSKLDLKIEIYYSKIKLCINTRLKKKDRCELKMALFENDGQEEFIMFV